MTRLRYWATIFQSPFLDLGKQMGGCAATQRVLQHLEETLLDAIGSSGRKRVGLGATAWLFLQNQILDSLSELIGKAI